MPKEELKKTSTKQTSTKQKRGRTQSNPITISHKLSSSREAIVVPHLSYSGGGAYSLWRHASGSPVLLDPSESPSSPESPSSEVVAPLSSYPKFTQCSRVEYSMAAGIWAVNEGKLVVADGTKEEVADEQPSLTFERQKF